MRSSSTWSAFLEAFDSRDDLTVDGCAQGLATEALHLAAAIDQVSSGMVGAIGQRWAVFDAVGHDAEWTAIPLFTMVLAAWARLEAHDVLVDSLSPRLVEQWAKVAEHCPSLVISDLLHAEAAVAFEQYGDLVSE